MQHHPKVTTNSKPPTKKPKNPFKNKTFKYQFTYNGIQFSILIWKEHNKFTVKEVSQLDIERLKRLNILAGELKQQGIAHNHEDAAVLAVSMVGEEEEQCLSDMHINEDQSLMFKEIVKNKPVVKHQEVVSEGISRGEAELLFQNFANALVHEFTALQQKIEHTNAQINEVTEHLAKMQSALQSIQIPKTQQVQEQVPVQRTLEQPVSQPVASGHPRTGNFATDDVCIEKMFYYGKK